MRFWGPETALGTLCPRGTGLVNNGVRRNTRRNVAKSSPKRGLWLCSGAPQDLNCGGPIVALVLCPPPPVTPPRPTSGLPRTMPCPGVRCKGRGLRGGPRGGWAGVRRRGGGGYCRLQMPLRPALGVRGTVAGRRPGALEGGAGSPPSIPGPVPMPFAPPVRPCRPPASGHSGPARVAHHHSERQRPPDRHGRDDVPPAGHVHAPGVSAAHHRAGPLPPVQPRRRPPRRRHLLEPHVRDLGPAPRHPVRSADHSAGGAGRTRDATGGVLGGGQGKARDPVWRLAVMSSAMDADAVAMCLPCSRRPGRLDRGTAVAEGSWQGFEHGSLIPGGRDRGRGGGYEGEKTFVSLKWASHCWLSIRSGKFWLVLGGCVCVLWPGGGGSTRLAPPPPPWKQHPCTYLPTHHVHTTVEHPTQEGDP